MDRESLIRYSIILVSFVVPLLVFLMFFFPAVEKGAELGWISQLPKVHAGINSLTALVLILGRSAIAKKNENLHKRLMLTAFGLSALFLISYVTYHSNSEPTRYGGEGILKLLYFALLITHIILAAVILPLILFSIYYGIKDKRNQHKRLVKWTYPFWLYVAISGVLVYLLLSPYYTL